MGFWSWSRTASSNATADATIGWSEGQAPSSVNDSARAMMARTAEWRDDISGTITTGGTSTAYTVTSNQVFDTLAHMNGAMIAFVPHATNGATVTLNVDGLGAKALRLSPSVELQSGVLILGTPYVATYVNADSSWYLQGAMGNPYGIPLGGMMPYTGNTAPNSAFAIPIGQAISQTTYATLYALYGASKYGADSGGNFLLPDLRGRAVFGIDSGGSARITVAGGNFDGTVVGGTGGGQNQTLSAAQLPVITPTFTGTPQTWSLNQATMQNGAGPVGPFSSTGAVTLNQITPTVTVTPAGSVSSFGSGTSHPIMPPAMTLPYILRVI